MKINTIANVIFEHIKLFSNCLYSYSLNWCKVFDPDTQLELGWIFRRIFFSSIFHISWTMSNKNIISNKKYWWFLRKKSIWYPGFLVALSSLITSNLIPAFLIYGEHINFESLWCQLKHAICQEKNIWTHGLHTGCHIVRY